MSTHDSLTLKPIGLVHSPYKQKFGTPRQSGMVPSAVATIQLNNERVPHGSLEGLNHYSHIWVLFNFHKNESININGKVKPPRLKGEKTGLFATRSPHRPNPLGMSLVKLEGIDEDKNQIVISGADLVDQTPVLDIKPYINTYDSRENASTAWPEKMDAKKLIVQWETDLFTKLKQSTQKFIEESLSFDLRNLEDKLKNDSTKIHKCFLDNYDVHFTYEDNLVLIKSIDLR